MPKTRVLKIAFTLLLAFFLVTTSFAAASPDPKLSQPFKDVKKTDWYYESVQKAIKLGFIKGFPDGTFRPNERVTIGQALSAAAKVIGEKCEAFPKSAHWASVFAQRYIKVGGMDYEPFINVPITRLQLYTIINNEFRLANIFHSIHVDPDAFQFTDFGASYNKPVISFMYASGIIKGKDSSQEIYAALDNTITRAELCAILVRAKEYKDNPVIPTTYLKPNWIPLGNPYVNYLADKRTNTHANTDISEEAIRDRYLQSVLEGRYSFSVVYNLHETPKQTLIDRFYKVFDTRRDLQPTSNSVYTTYHQTGDYVVLEFIILSPISEYYTQLSTIQKSLFPSGYEKISERERVDRITQWLFDNFEQKDKDKTSTYYGLEALATKSGSSWSYSSILVGLFRLSGLEAYTCEAYARLSFDINNPKASAITLVSVVIDGTTLYINPCWAETTLSWGNMDHYLLTKSKMEYQHIFKEDIDQE